MGVVKKMTDKIKVAVFGSTGYAGQELVRLLHTHPNVEINLLVSNSNAGEKYSDIYSNFYKSIDLECSAKSLEEVAKENIDIIFLAVPHGVSHSLITEEILSSTKIIDLSGDFRINSKDLYEKWYSVKHNSPELLEKVIYGLSEIHREQIKKSNFVANPGCFPTASILALAPLVQNKLIDLNSIIIDAKSGVSGAGRGVSLGTHFNEVNESVKPYKVGTHKHTIEIEQELEKYSGTELKVQFTPHLVPMNRGILITAYANLNTKINNVRDLYLEFYKDDKFIRIKESGEQVETRWVKNSNYVDIALSLDNRTNRVIVTAVIDNLIKGAAGQAIQNMNLMFEFNETLGINNLPSFPA